MNAMLRASHYGRNLWRRGAAPLFLLFAAWTAEAFELPDAVSAANSALFPSIFFPEIDQLPPETIYLAGLARLYPGRVIEHAPENFAAPGTRSLRAPLIEELPRGITYLRIYDLQSGLPQMAKSTRSPALIWDFRYLAGNYPQSRELLEVMAEPGAAQRPSLQTVGNFKTPQGDPPQEASEPAQARRPGQPVIVLVNQRTRGPVEAALDALQATGSILTVGTRTAGMTGSYQAAPGTQGFWVIDGEIQAAEGASLLGRGLTPEIAVAVTPEADFVGYQLLETGYATADILKLELPSSETGAEPNEEGTLRPSDPVLQRAVEIVIALQVLGKLPSSP